MSTIGIELCDVGVRAIKIDDDGNSRMLQLGDETLRYPAFACVKEGDLVFGSEAQELSMVYPRRTSSLFIDDLSFQSAILDGYGSRLAYSQIAYKFFQKLVVRLREKAGEFDRVIVGVPGHYLEANEASEQRLGLLLGILKDLELPIAGIVDMAAASLYSEGLWHVPEGESIFHVDLLLHAMHITVFKKEDGLRRVYFSRLPQHGFTRMQERFTGALANRFLKETSFDVTGDRDMERAFHSQTRDMLLHLGRVGQATLEVNTREKSRHMTISKEIVALDLAPQVKILTQLLLRAVNDFAGDDKSIQICLSERAAAIQGLKDAIIAQDIGSVNQLPIESAAFGAANYGKAWPIAEEIESVRIDNGIRLDGAVSLRSTKANIGLGSVRLVKEGKSLHPTHVVCDGLAYELSKPEVTIGIGESESFDVVVDRHETDTPLLSCRLVKSEERWSALDRAGNEIDPGTCLKAGDSIDVSLHGRNKRLLFIHCMVS